MHFTPSDKAALKFGAAAALRPIGAQDLLAVFADFRKPSTGTKGRFTRIKIYFGSVADSAELNVSKDIVGIQ